MKIKEFSKDDRPRERMLSFEAENLSNAELLAIIFRTGC
jgi:DNA repair protein RadC